jgi:hypothetical protein
VHPHTACAVRLGPLSRGDLHHQSLAGVSSFEFKRAKVCQAFRAIHQEHGEYDYDLEAGAFKESGTMVRTKIVVWRKPANDNGAED